MRWSMTLRNVIALLFFGSFSFGSGSGSSHSAAVVPEPSVVGTIAVVTVLAWLRRRAKVPLTHRP